MRRSFLATLLFGSFNFGQLFRQRPAHSEFGKAPSNTSRVCFVAEDPRVVQYGFAFNMNIPEDKVCGMVSCNVHKFMAVGLKEFVTVDEKDGKCHCTLQGHKLFALRHFKTCDVEKCWEQLSIVMSIAKRKEHEDFGADDFMYSHNHWTATCKTGESSVTTPKDIVKRLREEGNNKEADLIEGIVEVEKVEDEDPQPVTSQSSIGKDIEDRAPQTISNDITHVDADVRSFHPSQQYHVNHYCAGTNGVETKILVPDGFLGKLSMQEQLSTCAEAVFLDGECSGTFYHSWAGESGPRKCVCVMKDRTCDAVHNKNDIFGGITTIYVLDKTYEPTPKEGLVLPDAMEISPDGIDFSICPAQVIWDFNPRKSKARCHEVPSMKYCYTECCWSYLDEEQQLHALMLASKRKE